MGKNRKVYLQHKNNKNMKKIQKKKKERKFMGMFEHLVNSGVISFEGSSSLEELREVTNSINQDYRDNLPNLNDYTYETRPAMLSFMTAEAFESIKEISPYFYQDDNGEVHFVSEWSAD